jgi:hypothetical protein
MNSPVIILYYFTTVPYCTEVRTNRCETGVIVYKCYTARSSAIVEFFAGISNRVAQLKRDADSIMLGDLPPVRLVIERVLGSQNDK